jgi:hypothetical protein
MQSKHAEQIRLVLQGHFKLHHGCRKHAPIEIGRTENAPAQLT